MDYHQFDYVIRAVLGWFEYSLSRKCVLRSVQLLGKGPYIQANSSKAWKHLAGTAKVPPPLHTHAAAGHKDPHTSALLFQPLQDLENIEGLTKIEAISVPCKCSAAKRPATRCPTDGEM